MMKRDFFAAVLFAVIASVWTAPIAAQVTTGTIAIERRYRILLQSAAPGHVNVDTSLSKRFTLAGRSNFEFRWDAFNLFNHPGFGFPNQNLDSPTAGRITSTIVDNRSMQFSFKSEFLIFAVGGGDGGHGTRSRRRCGDAEISVHKK